jgi:molybdopterin molybdotransferase
MTIPIRTNARESDRRESNRPRPARYMIDPDEALKLVLEAAQVREPCEVNLEDARSLRLAEEIRSDRAYPPFDRAMMDGYAVHAKDAGHRVKVEGEIAAGSPSSDAFDLGTCVAIMTGAPCPPGTEAVVPKEDVELIDGDVVLPNQIKQGRFIAAEGSECAADRIVLKPSDVITPLATAVLASFGKARIRVTPQPTIGVITTGAELVPMDETPEDGGIRNSNGPMLAAFVQDQGLDAPVVLHAEDRLDAILSAVDSLADKDIIMFTGGVSVGNYDLVPDIVHEYGAEVIFHKAKQKPGKPLLFASKERQLVFGLPGNPLSCHFCFHRYVTAAIREMSGADAVKDIFTGRLTKPVRPRRDRTFFVLAEAFRNVESGSWSVRPSPGVSSADIFGSSRANCYIRAPMGRDEIPVGETVSFSLISGASINQV